MGTPLVTVVICTYNGEAFLEKTLRSVLGQTYSNFEVVIVDDGSTDGTTEIIGRFSRENNCVRPFFRINCGLPASRNFAFTQARGQWIAIIDQDDLCYPSRLSRQLEIASAYPSAGLIFCNTHYINEDDDVIGEHMSGFKLPEGFIRKNLASNLLLGQGCYIDSESCFIKRETFQRVGLLDESLRFACDYEYFIRAGFVVDFAYSWEILAAWRIHPRQATKTDKSRFKEIHAVYKRYFWNKHVSLGTKLALIINLQKSLALDFLGEVRARIPTK
jgi:glycosyltransferase involved in cell wall biosynthesis